jgi:phosphoribosyl 1,2-cyclic phosphodiesterase
MIQICALASGSNGNCYYIGNEHEAVLIDMGLSNRQLSQRMRETGLSLRKVKAIFITHEHMDHIKGMRVVCEKNNIAGYATQKTYGKARKDYRSALINYFSPGETIPIGSIKIHAFGKQHDAIDPVSFRIEIDEKNIAVLTDLGTANKNIQSHLSLCDAAFLEANYDYNLLMAGRYPTYLKNRVSSDYGHLSNAQAVELVESLGHSKLKTIFLSHISADNNRVDIALNAFKTLKNSLQIIATSRHSATKVVVI